MQSKQTFWETDLQSSPYRSGPKTWAPILPEVARSVRCLWPLLAHTFVLLFALFLLLLLPPGFWTQRTAGLEETWRLLSVLLGQASHGTRGSWVVTLRAWAVFSPETLTWV
jgi:hypothetical protein